MAHKISVADRVEKLAAPVAESLGLEIWDIEFVKEGSTYFLRFYIDKADGVTIDDCEAFSRAVDPELDRYDPIEQSYCLEVSSPGIERNLKKDWHFERYMGCLIKSRLIRPDDAGRREIEGKLVSFDNGYVGIEAEEGTVLVKQSEAAYIKLVDQDNPDNTFVEE